MKENLARRSFLFTSAIFGASLMSLSRRAMGEAVKWPESPKPPDASANPAIQLPALSATTEQKRGGGTIPLPPDKRIGFAVVGIGHLALEEIIPAITLSKMCRLTGLVSGDLEKAKRVARDYGVPETGIYNYENFERIKDNKDIQVIYIVLPNSMHHEYVLRSAKIGKDVLCEKPMATNVKDAEEMTEACKKAGVKLMIAYRQQYEPNNRYIEEMVRAKTFGKVKIFEANNSQNESGASGGKQQWRHVKKMAGGGALPDIGLYCLNACRFLTGEEPYEVTANQYSTPNDPRFKEVEETIQWMMRFPSGLVANCLASYGAHETKKYRFTAENGWFGMEPSFAYKGLKMEISYAMGGSLERYENPTMAEQNQFALEMDHMSDCVLHNKKPHSGGEEGIQDHRIMEAIYESARTRKPVELKRIEKLDSFRNPTIS